MHCSLLCTTHHSCGSLWIILFSILPPLWPVTPCPLATAPSRAPVQKRSLIDLWKERTWVQMVNCSLEQIAAPLNLSFSVC